MSKLLSVFSYVAFATGLVLTSHAQSSPLQSRVPVSGPTSISTTYDSEKLEKGELEFSSHYSPYASPDVREEKLTSSLMGRPMPFRVVLPAGYSNADNSSTRYPVIYLLHGLMGHYNNWTDQTRLAELVARSSVIVVTPEGSDGWYTDSATKENDKYESYIIHELIPDIDKRFRTQADRNHRAIAGLSMGGFGSIKFGLKYPEVFSLAGSFSGALGAASITEKEFPGAIGKTIAQVFGPLGSDRRRRNDVFDLVRQSTPDKIKAMPFLYIDCGTEDFLFQNNRDFIALLLEKKIRHEYRQLPGAHDWKYWGQQIVEFLQVAEKRLGGPRVFAKP